MAVNTFTKPYVLSRKGAKQLEDALKSPAPRDRYTHKTNFTTIDEMAKKYGTKK